MPKVVVHKAEIHASKDALIQTDAVGRALMNRLIVVASHFHTALSNQDPVFCCQTGCSDRAPTRLHWEYRASFFWFFFKQMNMPTCMHHVSRQLFASLWDSLPLLKRVAQKEGKQSKTKQVTLVHVCTIAWPLERGWSAAICILKKMEKHGGAS